MDPLPPKSRKDPSSTWTEPFTVRGYETDPYGRLSVLCLCQYLQEAAANHAAALGVGLEALNGRNLTWMLSRLRLWVKQLPAAGRRLAVDTWPSGGDRLFAFRDFAVSTDSGEPIADADSAWLVIDRARRRPLRIEPFLESLRTQERPPLLAKPIPKLPAPDAGKNKRRFQVRYRDLDANRHVNNVTYVEWVLEGTVAGFFGLRRPVRLELEYLAEALAGEAVVCTWAPADGAPETFVHGVFREADGRELARAKTVWEK